MEVPSRERRPASFVNQEQGPTVADAVKSAARTFISAEQPNQPLPDQEQLVAEASRLYDRALKVAGLDSQQVSDLFRVSVSLVDKWRNPNERACPSFWQINAHPIRFHLALESIRREQPAYRKAVLARVWDAFCDVALAVEA